MHPTPLVITIGGAMVLVLIPAVVVVLQGWLRYHAARWVARRWPNDDERERRDLAHTALTWRDLTDAQDARISDLERRVDAIESKSSKAERSLRRRGLWDSAKAGPA